MNKLKTKPTPVKQGNWMNTCKHHAFYHKVAICANRKECAHTHTSMPQATTLVNSKISEQIMVLCAR